MGSSIHTDIFIQVRSATHCPIVPLSHCRAECKRPTGWVQVDSDLSVSAAHAIGERVRHTLIRDFPLLTEAQIHIGNTSGSAP